MSSHSCSPHYIHAVSLPNALFTSLWRDTAVFHSGGVSVWNYIPISNNSLFPKGSVHHFSCWENESSTRHICFTFPKSGCPSPGWTAFITCTLPSLYTRAKGCQRSWSERSIDLAFRSEPQSSQGPFDMNASMNFFKNPRGGWKQLLHLYTTSHQLLFPFRNMQYYDNCLQSPACPCLPDWTS